MSAVRQYRGTEVLVQIRGLDEGLRVRVNLEHKSGAALIVPECDAAVEEEGYVFEMRGFDGTDYKMTVDETHRALHILASTPAMLLGDKTELELPRVEDLATSATPALRITGDEVTKPITVKR